MNPRHLMKLAAALFVLGALTVPARADLITNGCFGTGNLSGWTVFTTSNGTNGGPGLPRVDLFNVTGMGLSLAAGFNVGQLVFISNDEEGGGLTQMVMAPVAGLYTFSLDISSRDDQDGQINVAAGTFSILIDGVTVASDDLGGFTSPGQILRGALSGTVSLTPGSHDFEILITRPFLSGGTDTPNEYIDNASLLAPSVPEPGSIALLGTGLVALGYWRRRRTAA